MTSSANHTSHCAEILRQVVTCAAELTLEKLDLEDIISPTKSQRGNSGWATFILAGIGRDWSHCFRQRSIVKSRNGWIKAILFDGSLARM